MALIKCPECGKKISDMAESCPHCGMPTSEIKAAATISTNQPKKKNGMPTWLSALIITGSIILIGGIMLLFIDGKSSDNNVNQDSIQETETVEITYPNITAQGVEPFLMGSSMFGIPCKGNYYDTILLIKRYNAYEVCGEYHANDLSEEELLKFKKESGDIPLIVESYGYAIVIKDNDTLMKVIYDEKALIKKITVFSNHFQMQNGIQVGMSLKELYEKYSAKYYVPYEDFCGYFSTELEIPDVPNNIEIHVLYNKKYDKYYKGNVLTSNFYMLPSERIEDNSVILSFDICNYKIPSFR